MSMTWIYEMNAYRSGLKEAKAVMERYGAPTEAIAEIDRLYLQAEEKYSDWSSAEDDFEDGSEDYDSEDPSMEEGPG